MKNYYDILGITSTATVQEIKDAYKKLAQKFHPDINDNDDFSEAFKNINEAKETLLDEKKRKDYDQKLTQFTTVYESFTEEEDEQSNEDEFNLKQSRQQNYRKSQVVKKYSL